MQKSGKEKESSKSLSSSLPHQSSATPSIQRISRKKQTIFWWSVRQNNLSKGSDSRSNGSIKGEEQEGDSWPWTNYLNKQTFWERHRCPRLDDWRPGLHMCALCIWAFCSLWILQCQPWSQAGISRLGDGKKTVLSYFSYGAGLEGGCCVLGRLVVLEPCGANELYFQNCVLSQGGSCNHQHQKSLIAWSSWTEGWVAGSLVNFLEQTR